MFHDAAGALISLGVEMDPPGGWFAIEVEAATGREVSRKENFSQDYIGIYGRGSP